MRVLEKYFQNLSFFCSFGKKFPKLDFLGYVISTLIKDENVLERELRSLQKTGDHYPKILLTLDMDLEADYDGIRKINVVDWLLKEE